MEARATCEIRRLTCASTRRASFSGKVRASADRELFYDERDDAAHEAVCEAVCEAVAARLWGAGRPVRSDAAGGILQEVAEQAGGKDR